MNLVRKSTCIIACLAVVLSLALVLRPASTVAGLGPYPTTTAVSGSFSTDNFSGTGTFNPTTRQFISGYASGWGSSSGDVQGTAHVSFKVSSNKWFGTTDDGYEDAAAPCTIVVGSDDYSGEFYLDGGFDNFTLYPVTGNPNLFGWTANVGAPVDGNNAWGQNPSTGLCVQVESLAYSGTAGGDLTVTNWATGTFTIWGFFSGNWSGMALGLKEAAAAAYVHPGSGTTGSSSTAQLDYTVADPGSIVVAQYAGNPDGSTPSLSLGKYISVGTSIPSSSITSVGLRIYYSNADLAAAGIEESTLQLYTWSGSAWVPVTSSGIGSDANGMYVSAPLSHFSDYAVLGDPAPVVQVLTATHTGTATLSASSGTIQNLQAVSLGSLPPPPISKPVFPDGMFSFDITGVSPAGSTVTVDIQLPSGIPANAAYWKYDSINGWSQIPYTVVSANEIAITLTDGGIGDSDGIANRTITDPGGLGGPGPSGGGSAPVFPSIYVGIGAALGAGILAYAVRRRLARQ